MTSIDTAKHPAVSIGMPVYNGEPYLREALDSLLAQCFTDFELIISDNDSQDLTASICEDYARRDPRIRYFRQQRNIGAIANFQFVLDESTGDHFMWAAADDRWDADWLASLHDCATGTGHAAFGRVLHMDEHSALVAHPATGRSFDFTGPALLRRMRFFVEFEGTGKANLFYSLYPRAMMAGLDLLTFEHDYHVIFFMLRRIPIEAVASTTLHKRLHANAASTLLIRQGRGLFQKILLRLVLPVDVEFLRGYFAHAGWQERCGLVAALPLKYLFAYYHMALRLRDALDHQMRSA